jgi:tRNA1Val (adenine37-N6)-methyltransferase
MSKTVFRFKQFEVSQEKSAMKIGTDGVLLGAWANAENSKRILDIGTGTGLISLMLAQRFPSANISGLEIDKNAAEEAKFNFTYSPFAKRLTLFESSLQNFDSDEKFDFIVSNPPFFDFTHPENSARNTARQQTDLTLKELLVHSNRLLSENGKSTYIIPYDKEDEFVSFAANLGLYPNKITRVKGNAQTTIKRSLILFSRKKTDLEIDELIIEIERNVYTEEYIQLTRDFYLKM